MRIRYRYARSLLAGFLAVVLLFSLVPAASAAQQNSYHDPAENWKEALDRTNELDANAVVTHETFDCAYCNQARDFIVYRTPEYYIDRLSCHIASTGKQYHSHAATIYKWAQEDAAKGKAAPKQGIPDYSCKEGESL